MSKHTELPWSRIGACIYMGSPGSCDATTGEPKWGGFNLSECPDPEANAQIIVTAVNNHAKLVKALREVSEELADELRGKYHGILGYPSTDRDYAADMDSANKARTLLAQLDGELE